MKVMTYEERVGKMHTPDDVGEQLRLAKAYVFRLRRTFKKAACLAEKVELEAALKAAESVLRRLRLNVFDLEDRLREKQSP